MTSINLMKKISRKTNSADGSKPEDTLQLQKMICRKSGSAEKFLNYIQILADAEKEGKIAVIRSTCTFDEVGGTGEGNPWYNDIISFFFKDTSDDRLYALSADTYHGCWSLRHISPEKIQEMIAIEFKEGTA